MYVHTDNYQTDLLRLLGEDRLGDLLLGDGLRRRGDLRLGEGDRLRGDLDLLREGLDLLRGERDLRRGELLLGERECLLRDLDLKRERIIKEGTSTACVRVACPTETRRQLFKTHKIWASTLCVCVYICMCGCGVQPNDPWPIFVDKMHNSANT